MTKNSTTFLGGAVAGLALGVAASLFLNSKTGKQVKKEMGTVLADFYKYASPKIKRVKKMGEQEYKEFMNNLVEQFGELKHMSKEAINELSEHVQDSWDSFASHIREEEA